MNLTPQDYKQAVAAGSVEIASVTVKNGQEYKAFHHTQSPFKHDYTRLATYEEWVWLRIQSWCQAQIKPPCGFKTGPDKLPSSF